MNVKNNLITESFDFNRAGSIIGDREAEVADLSDVAGYIRQIGEKLTCDKNQWLKTEVECGITMEEWLFLEEGTGSRDLRALLLDLYDKDLSEYEADFDETLLIALGTWGAACKTEAEYREARRAILRSLKNPADYAAFMRSCFINSVFAKGVDEELKKIKDFRLRTETITENLSVLNDEAVDLYYQYRSDLGTAMKILSSKLLECSPDPKHKGDLIFEFEYEKKEGGRTIIKTKEIECSPHTKLIHKGSNLRIYFYWCDDIVGNGEKVLIGEIGRHPWKK